MSPPSPDADAALQRIGDEVAALRRTLAALTDANATLQARLAQSEAARADLLAQTEHIISLLADARAEIRALQGSPLQAKPGTGAPS